MWSPGDQSLKFSKLRRFWNNKLSQLHRGKIRCQKLFTVVGLATFFQFKSETAFRLKKNLSSKKSNIATIRPFLVH